MKGKKLGAIVPPLIITTNDNFHMLRIKATTLNHTTHHTLIAFSPGHHPGVHPSQPPTHRTTPPPHPACMHPAARTCPTHQPHAFFPHHHHTHIEPPFHNQYPRRIITQHRSATHTHTPTPKSPTNLPLCDPNRGVSNHLQQQDQAQSAPYREPSEKLLGIDTRRSGERWRRQGCRDGGAGGFDDISTHTHTLSTVINPSLSLVGRHESPPRIKTTVID